MADNEKIIEIDAATLTGLVALGRALGAVSDAEAVVYAGLMASQLTKYVNVSDSVLTVLDPVSGEKRPQRLRRKQSDASPYSN